MEFLLEYMSTVSPSKEDLIKSNINNFRKSLFH